MSVYEDRKLADPPQCTRCGKRARDGHQLCRKHLADQRRYNAKWARKRARLARRKKRCRYCIRKVTMGRSCLACREQRKRYRTLLRARKKRAVDKAVDRGPDRMVLRPDGRIRSSGKGSRGRTESKVIDDQDLDYAMDAIAKAKDGLARARGEQSAQFAPAERRAAKLAALAHAAHGVRFVEEVLDRNRFHDAPAASARR